MRLAGDNAREIVVWKAAGAVDVEGLKLLKGWV